MRNVFIIGFMFLYVFAHAQQAKKRIRSANDFYKEKEYEKARNEYKKVPANDSLHTLAQFNLANTFYRMGEKDEAIKTFSDLAGNEKDSLFVSGLYYNKGVVLTSQQKLEESIEAYKTALLRNPDDKDARENLQKALLELKKKNSLKQEKKKQQERPQMNPKDEEEKLKQLEQKEKQLQQRMQNQRAKTGNQAKDW